jgi:hypothetical protein
MGEKGFRHPDPVIENGSMEWSETARGPRIHVGAVSD